VVALVAGVLGILGTALGGVVGGVVSNKGAEALQKQAAHRADQERADAVRAAARLLLSDLVTIRGNVISAVEEQRWDPGDYRIEVSYRDRNLLAAEMSDQGWGTVSRALLDTGQFYAVRHRFIDTTFDYSNNGRSTDMDWAVSMADSSAEGIVVLAKLGGLNLQTSGLKDFVSRTMEPRRLKKYRTLQ
jgi:hypothetical protein